MRTALAFATLLATAALAQNSTTGGVPTSPWPTLFSLSFDWPIQGDDNANGTVSVRYRRQDDSVWKSGLPLRRVVAGSNEGFSWGNRHTGSLFDLVPGTAYDIELTLTDPEGGNETHSLTVRTRTEPQASVNGRKRSVNPGTFNASLSSLQPGDIVTLEAGTYSGFTLERDGTEAQPIVIRSEPAFSAVINGTVALFGRKHVILEGLRINGNVRLNDCEFVTIRRNRIVTTAGGINGYGEPKGILVLDNVISGATTWAEAALGVNGNNVGEGVELSGPGHVICFNKVTGFRDAISTLEGTEAKNQQSIDICNNDLEVGADDAIEADFTMGNVRVTRNRISNSFVGISGQPTLGGPLYAIRNVMQNIVYSPFKLHRGSIGDVALHNTVIKCGDAFAVYAGVPWSRAYFRNNLFIGGVGGKNWGGFDNGDGRVLQLPDAQASCDFDYDGLGSIGTGVFRGRVGGVSFDSVSALRAMTTEQHAIQVDLSVFANPVVFPLQGPFPAQARADLRLAPSGGAVDKGMELDNVNDGFLGSAPDLGAYEVGNNVPIYGPRPTGLAAECGNGLVEEGEGCDDSNTVSGDGCSALCAQETTSGTATDGGGVLGRPDGAVLVDGGVTRSGAPQSCGCQESPWSGLVLVSAWVMRLLRTKGSAGGCK